ncbi:Cytochrome c oxidase biogenesis protein Cmc1-like [Parasponia andersonii]|uniref:COX assembly mitochondrial protein n=1 Tax=Parasponia andersonii TaxID=3476 RepID=A0A2P5BR59_PARAD|nr:Cytochrome c oxidase biogenesis protein Cmc1-like [Parasponia andersonii]
MAATAGEEANEISECRRLQRALSECHRRIPSGNSACRHLNRALAECLVSTACPEQYDAVKSLCSSSGTALKRSQCQEAQLSLSFEEKNFGSRG